MTNYTGTQSDDTYTAGSSVADIFTLLGGNDYASGGAGDDSMYGGAGDDTLNGDGGNDVLSGGLGKDKLSGGDGDDFLYGGGGDKGDVDNHTLFDDGNDVLEGGAGNDLLWGMGGNDTLTGGIGNDTFIFGPNEGRDIITDFKPGEDHINLSYFFKGADLDSNANGVVDKGDLNIMVDQNNFMHITISGTEMVVRTETGNLHLSDFV